MRLRDLDVRFVFDVTRTGARLSQADTVDGAQGVMFQCPACAVGKERGQEDGRGFICGAHYIRVLFSNPRGVAAAPPEADENPRWEMSGSSIDDLTLSPSINLDVPGQEDGCRWHGFVRNGDAA
jgi:hypothetical protein